MIASLLTPSKVPLIMGIINLTPDSFSDGSPYATTGDFLKKAESLIEDGADILDVGGESTRPQAAAVSVAEEMRRLLPFLRQFRKQHPHFPLSVDTRNFETAQAALAYEIQILNDVSFLSDPRFLELLKKHPFCFYILMHTRGNPQTMTALTDYPDGLIATMRREINAKLRVLSQHLPLTHVILDPGFGFAKTPDQCHCLMERLEVWSGYRLPLLFGISRKRFLKKYVDTEHPADRDVISAFLAKTAVQNGFHIIRTHNVSLTRKILKQEGL